MNAQKDFTNQHGVISWASQSITSKNKSHSDYGIPKI